MSCQTRIVSVIARPDRSASGTFCGRRDVCRLRADDGAPVSHNPCPRECPVTARPTDR
jgi:hypothetical protein